jgi:Ser/Thr protein kinase RdoA (MazF antagonist)
VHGDAHLHNCFAGPAGTVWHDFETACLGPRELDLAALVLGDRDSGVADLEARAALEAYGDHDADLLEECLPIYAAWIYASFMVALPRHPELGPRLAVHLRWLRDTFG